MNPNRKWWFLPPHLGLSKNLLSRLLRVQNAAARLLTGTRKRSGISPVLAALHWLPVDFRIQSKVLIMVFKGLHGLAPEYISCLLQQHCVTRPLRSSQSLPLHVSRSQMWSSLFCLWNGLPLHIISCDSLNQCWKHTVTLWHTVVHSCRDIVQWWILFCLVSVFD